MYHRSWGGLMISCEWKCAVSDALESVKIRQRSTRHSTALILTSVFGSPGMRELFRALGICSLSPT
eukprot:scaffold8038_cov363-Prasinococcus_capsulatus_cf.AAC.2